MIVHCVLLRVLTGYIVTLVTSSTLYIEPQYTTTIILTHLVSYSHIYHFHSPLSLLHSPLLPLLLLLLPPSFFQYPPMSSFTVLHCPPLSSTPYATVLHCRVYRVCRVCCMSCELCFVKTHFTPQQVCCITGVVVRRPRRWHGGCLS